MEVNLHKLSDARSWELAMKYFQQLEQPVDDYYRKVVVRRAKGYEVKREANPIGNCWISAEGELVLWDFQDKAMHLAQSWMEDVLKQGLIHSAMVSTRQSRFLSLALEYQKEVAVDSYLFEPKRERQAVEMPIYGATFVLADRKDVQRCKEIVGEPYEGYLLRLYEQRGLFVAKRQEEVLCMGELRVDEQLPEYADLGMATLPEHRRKGLASFMIAKLLEQAQSRGLIANAACNFSNIGSKKSLENGGMVASHRMLQIRF